MKYFKPNCRIINLTILIFLLTDAKIQGQKSEDLSIKLSSYNQSFNNYLQTDIYDKSSIIFDSSRVFKGIPKYLSSYIIKTFDFQPEQGVYEYYIKANGAFNVNFLLGGFESLRFKIEDTINLSRIPIKHFVSFLVGKTTSGKNLIVGDQNNNYDFSDDKIFLFDTSNINQNSKENSYGVSNFHYQYSYNGKVKNQSIYLRLYNFFESFKYFNSKENLHYLVISNDKLKRGIFFQNGNSYVFEVLNISYQLNIYDSLYSNIFIYNNNSDKNIIPFKIRDTVYLGNRKYLLKSISIFGDTLSLKSLGIDDKIFGVDSGKYAYDINGLNMINNSGITLNNFKGKYLLIDFWGTWCVPCKALTGEIKSLRNITDTSKVELLSIAFDINEDLPKKYILDNKLNWSHIFQKQNGKNYEQSIISKYKISFYPTFILISPEGKIIARETGTNGWIKIRNKVLTL